MLITILIRKIMEVYCSERELTQIQIIQAQMLPL